ncbi:agmatinase [Methylophaga thalassica]|uniref:Arginase/agmatinase/formimionoglutamate hydrolase, arginase family n=1 Tax=Methylophaga aminisulfidivorans MP TaxID=1026882 RepID=F5SX54_9GAMM|nr:agmatinase [Methylophaga aminisulfidivorans]EGL54947.1 arginase/agmatinase/formimionoglutamate hydrolase, arginase family [Methylophaga aminisulfidivorans MP]
MEDYPIFLGSEIEQPEPAQALFHVLPVPYEKTVSYGGGTALGPNAILQASWQLEEWDGKSKPCDEGIYTCEPVDCSVAPQQVIDNIAKATADIVKSGGMPVVLGGEHTVTYGVIKGLRDAGIEDFGIVQIDAHADLRQAYEGDFLSHASVMKRAVDMGIPLYQLGIRAYCEEEMAFREEFGVLYQDADELVPNRIQSIELPDDFPQKVFFTLDIDGMDPSVFPSTGTPVPGGLDWYQTLNLFESVAKQREIIGFDIMEFAPIEGFHAYDFSASLLTYKLMGIVQRNRH